MADAITAICFEAGPSTVAQDARARLVARYGNTDVSLAQAIVALGGDGFMLQTLHKHMDRGLPVYGMKRGTVGFLMNHYHEDNLTERLCQAHTASLHPLRMQARRKDGKVEESLALNEVSLLRETRQAARVKITINGRERLSELVCDGILVATPAGSTAYNLSAYGPILPLDAGVLALTPISPFRPRRWRGALLSRNAAIRLEILEPEKRPVSATADGFEVRNVIAVDVKEVRDISINLMFDPEHNLEERIMGEQFGPE